MVAIYGDYAWNVLGDHELGLRMTQAAAHAAPNEPAYLITETRMLVAMGQMMAAREKYRQLEQMNIGGSLDKSLQSLRNNLDN